MKYLCMIFYDEKVIEAMPDDEYKTLVRDALAYDDVLRRGGHFLAAQALQPVSTATKLHVRSGKVSITDGPFAETKEQFGGFILIEARDLDQAIQLASKIPAADRGTVEVRPVLELEPLLA